MAQKLRQKRRDGLKRQAQLMEVAMNIFAEKGYHSTSVEDIVNTAGVAKGTFYLHFEGKKDVLDKIIDSYFSTLYESLKLLDISIPKPVEELKEIYMNVCRALIADTRMKQFVRLLLSEMMGLDKGLTYKINDFFNRMVQMSAGYMRKAQDEGRVFDGIDPVLISHGIIGSVKEILYQWAVIDENIDLERGISDLVEVYFRGIIIK